MVGHQVYLNAVSYLSYVTFYFVASLFIAVRRETKWTFIMVCFPRASCWFHVCFLFDSEDEGDMWTSTELHRVTIQKIMTSVGTFNYRCENISCFRRESTTIQTSFEAYQATCTMGTGGSLLRARRPRREADRSPQYNVEVKNGGAIPPLPLHLHGMILNQSRTRKTLLFKATYLDMPVSNYMEWI
jgi:hypothetical protein